MRVFILLAALVPALALAAMARADGPDTLLLSVDDGDLFYDLDNDCVGDTDVATGARALRHWHVGLPFAPAAAEVAGGFGCLGPPKTWTVTVPDGATATVSGRIRYTWDTNVPGGGTNDVHLHVTDASGALVYSTLVADGWAPIVPMVAPSREHVVQATLGPGSYTLAEDVFTGEHSAWLTRLTVVAS